MIGPTVPRHALNASNNLEQKMDPDERQNSSPTLSSLPKELLIMIFAYDEVSLDQLYKFRILSRHVGPTASLAFVNRVHHVLVSQKDVSAFQSFVKRIRTFRWPLLAEPNNEDDESDDGFQDNPLDPFSLGRLLKCAKVPIDSFAAVHLAKSQLTEFGGSLGDAASVFLGMGATPQDVKLVLFALGYLRSEPQYMSVLARFVELFAFDEATVVDLYLSLKSLPLSTRFQLVWDLLDFPNAAPVDFRLQYWPRIVSTVRQEFPASNEQVVEQLYKVLFDQVQSLLFCTDHILGQFLTPIQGLSATDCAQIFVRFDHFCLCKLDCYLADPNEDDEDKESNAPSSDLVSKSQSRSFFQELAKHSNFISLVASFITQDIWPKHLLDNSSDTPSNLDIKDLNHPHTILKILHKIGDERTWSDDESAVSRLRKFIQANSFNRERWILWTRDRLEELCEWEGTSVEEELVEEAESDRFVVSVLLEALESADGGEREADQRELSFGGV